MGITDTEHAVIERNYVDTGDGDDDDDNDVDNDWALQARHTVLKHVEIHSDDLE